MNYLFILCCLGTLFTAHGQVSSPETKQILGPWVSLDDTKFHVVFNDTTKQDFYEGRLQRTARYWLRHDSLIAKNVGSGDSFSYAIMGLTETQLTLMYLERGNFAEVSTAVVPEENCSKELV